MKDEHFSNEYFIGVEGGGTKYKVLIASDPTNILCQTTIPTTSPVETIGRINDFISPLLSNKSTLIRAIGIGQFGPLQLNPDSRDYGMILNTPKPGWSGTNIIHEFKRITSLPIVIDTDVGAAAMGEMCYGAEQSLDNFVYITIGTGIGGAIMQHREIIHGLLHPELGHMLIPHNHILDPFEGSCKFHKDCFEGLASGTALFNRWKIPAEFLAEDHQAWNLESVYIAQALANLFLVIMPQKFILGGGVMHQQHLYPRIIREFQKIINNYLDLIKITPAIDQYIQAPTLGQNAGCIGAIALAKKFYQPG